MPGERMSMENLEKIIESRGKRFLLKVETSLFPKDYLKYEELREKIWGIQEDNMPGSRNMMCENIFHDGSSLFIAVYAESEEGDFSRQDREYFVGYSYGYVGVKDKKNGFRSLENLKFFSLYTGVKREFEHFGLGVFIKEFQKEQLINLYGIYTINCTYDPLTGVNAYRNIHRLGMEVLNYRVDIYGEFGGNLNRVDVPSDRFVMSWDLMKEVKRPAYNVESLLTENQIANEVEYSRVDGKHGSVELAKVSRVNLDQDHEFLMVEIPVDFYQMLRETDVKEEEIKHIPLDWRMKTRDIFQTLFKRGYRVIDFRMIEGEHSKRDFYILKRLKK
jgi:predicted GNAT superfamily acetyltransferase